jgi:hypothetical protein
VCTDPDECVYFDNADLMRPFNPQPAIRVVLYDLRVFWQSLRLMFLHTTMQPRKLPVTDKSGVRELPKLLDLENG